MNHNVESKFSKSCASFAEHLGSQKKVYIVFIRNVNFPIIGTSSKCIPRYQVCDNVVDCADDQADETGCLLPPAPKRLEAIMKTSTLVYEIK